MAKGNAQRVILVSELEEQQHTEVAPPPLQRQRPNKDAHPWSTRLVGTLAVIGILFAGGLMLDVYFNAATAKCAYQQLDIHQQMNRVDRKITHLTLLSNLLSAQPRLHEIAAAQGFVEPDIKQVHIVAVSTEPRWSVLARLAPESHDSWLTRSVRHLVACLNDAMQSLSPGPGVPAYAR
jgi:hypothetical protein